MLPEHETWSILDSTKLTEYMDCPRKYFYKYILGWNIISQANHLAFGRAWHLGMEAILRGEGTEKAFKDFLEDYRQEFSTSTDTEVGVKTPDNARMALGAYAETYKDDNFEVEHIEVPGYTVIGEDTLGIERKLYYNIDTICKNHLGHFCLEHKTTTRQPSQWQTEWILSLQIGTYAHVLRSLYDDAFGVIINGVILRQPKRIKKDGTPYAGSKGTEFIRVPVKKSNEQMQVWLAQVNSLYYQIEYETGIVHFDTKKVSNSAMMSFPLNTGTCTKYGQCPYWDFCCSWVNPAARACEMDEPPIGFERSFWDPRIRERVKG